MNWTFEVVFSGGFSWCVLEINRCRHVSISWGPGCEPVRWSLVWKMWKVEWPTNRSGESWAEKDLVKSSWEGWKPGLRWWGGIQHAWCRYLMHLQTFSCPLALTVSGSANIIFITNGGRYVSPKKSCSPFLGITDGWTGSSSEVCKTRPLPVYTVERWHPKWNIC